MAQSLDHQIQQCDSYELAPLFLSWLGSRQPVLEAGCGSGRWCKWLSRYGITCHGIDWSEVLCRRAVINFPHSGFATADIRFAPFSDESFGAILALGSVEHAVDGPQGALGEFLRILKPGGVAIITVPYRGALRKLMRFADNVLVRIKAWPALRKRMGKGVGPVSLRTARIGVNASWFPRYSHGQDGWFFYEYEFSRAQMRGFISATGFIVRREFAAFTNEGILHTFGPISGQWNPERAQVDFTVVGRVLRAILSGNMAGHMLCYVLEKPRSHS